ncbi:MAG TPA: CoA transferase [Pseudonocardia sp.]|nr:CoA transferase [Pseudonocardia sp.]
MDGFRVLDLTTTFMGPYATMLMARMGADVVKIEGPGGDVVRHIGSSRSPGMGPIYLTANHGKRSVALDLKVPQARDALLRLVETADVFVTNLRPAALRGLQVTADELCAINPRLVYCTLPGFGAGGPYRDRPAYDDVIQAASGLAATQGGTGEPQYIRNVIADKTTALMGVSAVLAALLSRSRTGRGQCVEVPMFETMVSYSLVEQLNARTFLPPRASTGYARTSSPSRRPYRTADGHLGVMIYTDRQWLSFFGIIGSPHLAHEERFSSITRRTENIDELYELVADVLPTRTTADWLAAFEPVGIAAQRVVSPDELFDDPHLAAVDMFEEFQHHSEGAIVLPRLPINFAGQHTAPVRGAPLWGEHGAELLRETGLDAAAIAQLHESGALLGADPAEPQSEAPAVAGQPPAIP